jgi:hypothetical protein
MIALSVWWWCVSAFFAHVEQGAIYGPLLRGALHDLRSSDSIVVWVYCTDKDGSGTAAPLSPRTIRRLHKAPARPASEDRPLSIGYIETLRAEGLAVRRTSRWLNAVSGRVRGGDLARVSRLPFVREIELVARFKRRNGLEGDRMQQTIPPQLSKPHADSYDTTFYGLTYPEVSQLRIPEVHRAGYFGEDVVVALMDAGFNNLGHEVFDSLRVMATWDFVNGDTSVADDPGQLGSGSHGTYVLSLLAGYKPGTFVGPAFRSTYILTKTENTDSETSLEEDNWVAAMEWADSLGADVISTSLGYREMEVPPGTRSYDWTWMTGDSTVITRAANVAVSRGIVVVIAAGNEGFDPDHNSLLAPADGDSIIAVGSVDADGERSFFSSVGPTTRGAIKPNVMARGSSVTVAVPGGRTAYGARSGTSLSCPLVSGICAMMLSAHPALRPHEIRNALQRTAAQGSAPDVLSGYGLANAVAATNYYGTVVFEVPLSILPNAPNPFSESTTIVYELGEPGRVRVELFNALGQRVRTLADEVRPVGRHTILWDGRNRNGFRCASGVYFVRVRTEKRSDVRRMLLLKD